VLVLVPVLVLVLAGTGTGAVLVWCWSGTYRTGSSAVCSALRPKEPARLLPSPVRPLASRACCVLRARICYLTLLLDLSMPPRLPARPPRAALLPETYVVAQPWAPISGARSTTLATPAACLYQLHCCCITVPRTGTTQSPFWGVGIGAPPRYLCALWQTCSASSDRHRHLCDWAQPCRLRFIFISTARQISSSHS
jgi:hypothetical protein